MKTFDVDVLIPIFNEGENIDKLCEWIAEAEADWVAVPTKVDVRYLFIDDGSNDNTVQTLKPYLTDPKFDLICNNFNQGKSESLMRGINATKGEILVFMDGDCQDRPQEIPKIFNKLIAEDFDMVIGWRANRQDGILKKKVSGIYSWLIWRLFRIHLNDANSGLKVSKRAIFEKLPLHGNNHRTIAVAAVLDGFKVDELPVMSEKRFAGKSKYSLFRLDGLVSILALYFFYRSYKDPMIFFGKTALILGGISILPLLAFCIWQLLFLFDLVSNPVITRPLLIMSSAGIILATIIFALGFTCDFIIRRVGRT